MRESTFWSVTVPQIMTVYANLIFAVLWVGFIIALIVNRDWLDTLWHWVQALPLVPKIIVWILILPIMVGLWIWESSWSTLGQIVGFACIVAWTVLAVTSIPKTFQ